MLKKLVRYGNSNAIILDKAILELLNIEEGSVVKIKTDGISIIITPLIKTVSEKVEEIFTHDQATIEASVKEGVKRYNTTGDQEEKLEKDLASLIKKQQALYIQLGKNPEFVKELTHIVKTFDVSSPDYMEAYKALRNKFSPELMNTEEKMKNFQSNNNLSVQEKYNPAEIPSQEQQKAMEQEFFTAHKKNQAIYKTYGELLNNPEYQHKAQLLAEEYATHKNSTTYLNAVNDLTDSYLPEYKQAREELKAIAERYSSTTKK